MKFKIIPIFAFFLFFTAGPLYADRDDIGDVLEQLAIFNFFNELEGYESVVDPLILLLDEDESEYNEIYMKKNRSYMISIVCDDDCDDVDVWLFDDDGDLVDSDTDGDDTAILKGRPDESGTYTVKIRVVDCDKEPCYVGAQAFILD